MFAPNLASLAPAASLLSAAVVLRQGAKFAFERRSLARRPVGADGVIPGAAAFTLTSSDPGAPAALLLHGFGDTPQTLTYLATRLNERGWTVRVPLLPGHGRTLADFARSRAVDWQNVARSELASLRAAHHTVALVGLSMGGALATSLAAEVSTEVPAGVPKDAHALEQRAPVVALVLLAPYLALPTQLRIVADASWAISPAIAYLAGRGVKSILDPEERERSLAYGAATPRLIHELSTVARQAWATLPAINIPTMIIQSHQDNRIAPHVAESAFARLTVGDKRLEWVDRGAHVITVDWGRDQVADSVVDWLNTHTPHLAPRTPSPTSRMASAN